MRTAVLICPGRGSYGKNELGYLDRHHGDKADLIATFDRQRLAMEQDTVSALDGASRFSISKYSRGDVASPLVYAASICDSLSLAEDIEVVAVTGNSMGWYSALAAGGALSEDAGFEVVNTMGRLMQERLIGGQLIYPFVNEDWRDDPDRKQELLEGVAQIDARKNHTLRLSIKLGGLLVLAGNEAGLAAFEAEYPEVQGRFPMRLKNHAAFHTALQAPVAEEGRRLLPQTLFGQPRVPLIDGRGHVFWPHASDLQELWRYTFGPQVVETYDFTHAISTAAREFAPDLFIVAGPGTTMGGAVAQSLILANWMGMSSKQDFQERNAHSPFLLGMGDEQQRRLVESCSA